MAAPAPTTPPGSPTRAASGVSGHRSYSQLGQLRRCSYAYKLERVDGVAGRPSCPAVAGRIVHKATETVDEMLYDNRNTDDLTLYESAAQTLIAETDREVARLDAGWPIEDWKHFGRKTHDKPNGEDWAWWVEHGMPQAVTAYINWRTATGFTLAEIPGFGPAIEVPFELTIGGTLVKGFIDRIFATGAGWAVCDIKSGNKPKSDEQLGLYARALETALGKPVPYGFYVYGLKAGEAKATTAFDLSHWSLSVLEDMYRKADLLIQNEIYLPSPGDQCFVACSVSHACPFFTAAI